ncbi:MAG: universal stress protein [Alphaproteobacteria bacterium]|nr:universal stress protein [Alphaproteobacteria bacterium]MBV9151225.1 universal stress protein [Alphaproteobacteria bacterium]MBV9586484.1 universal stress protein [Alphaproteobacteria bacterium]MBV9966849.1 universal stress protein [Alphaproteobacteria bacterium]
MSDSTQPRVFLVVIDETEEYRVAVHYAARRAAHTGGRLALLYVIEPAEMQQWLAVEELARAERREAAEELLQRLCEEIAPVAGSMPIVYIREGRRPDELLALIGEEPSISILVLAAGTGPEGPGPLISYLTGKPAARLRIPVTIVPGGLTLDQLDALS